MTNAEPRVYELERDSSKGKPEDAVVDVDSVDRLVPVLVDVCTQRPHESFSKQLKDESKKTK